MGNIDGKESFDCTNEQIFVKSSVPAARAKSEGEKPESKTYTVQKINTNVEQTHVSTIDTRETSFATSNNTMTPVSSDDIDDLNFPKPQLKTYDNSSSEKFSCRLSILRENEERKGGARKHGIDYVTIPSVVADFVKPQNARKDVMDLFEVIGSLGDGMSSCVFEVKYIPNGEKYALKRLRRAQAHSDLLFAGECKFLSVLKTQGVVRTIDAFVDEKYFYVLNELGVTDLFKKIKADTKLSEKIAKEIVRYLLETIKELHQNNMVHRDIKPENVIFTDKDSNFPKIIDFGDAIVVSDNGIYTELVGTKCYLAPERWRHHYGWELKASDIWAVGVLTYEMVTGKRCFYASSDRQLVEKIQKTNFKFSESVQPSKICCHFIRSLITADDRHRPSAEFALTHPWLSTCEKADVQKSLAETWNDNVSEGLNWTVYNPEKLDKIF